MKIGEDIVFNFNVFNSNLKYVYIDTHEYQYIINDQSTLKLSDYNKISCFEKTLECLKSNISINGENNKKIKNVYYLFGCTFFRVIIMNYIFNKENKSTYKKKVDIINSLYNKDVYRECLKEADLQELKLSRKIPILLIRYKLYFILYVLIKIREKDVG